jgi:hypothetical protein
MHINQEKDKMGGGARAVWTACCRLGAEFLCSVDQKRRASGRSRIVRRRGSRIKRETLLLAAGQRSTCALPERRVFPRESQVDCNWAHVLRLCPLSSLSGIADWAGPLNSDRQPFRPPAPGFIPAASYYPGEAAHNGVLQGLQKGATRCFLQIWSDGGPRRAHHAPSPPTHPTTSRASSCCAGSRWPAPSVLLHPTVEREGEGIRLHRPWMQRAQLCRRSPVRAARLREGEVPEEGCMEEVRSPAAASACLLLMTIEAGHCWILGRPPAPSSTHPPWRRGSACRGCGWRRSTALELVTPRAHAHLLHHHLDSFRRPRPCTG